MASHLRYHQLWRVWDFEKQEYIPNPNHLYYENGVEVDPEEYNFISRSEARKEVLRRWGPSYSSAPFNREWAGRFYFQSEGWYSDDREVE